MTDNVEVKKTETDRIDFEPISDAKNFTKLNKKNDSKSISSKKDSYYAQRSQVPSPVSSEDSKSSDETEDPILPKVEIQSPASQEKVENLTKSEQQKSAELTAVLIIVLILFIIRIIENKIESFFK